MFRRIKTNESCVPAKLILLPACVPVVQPFLMQNELPLPMTPKQYVISEQSISRTEKNCKVTLPSALKHNSPMWRDTSSRSARDTRRRRRRSGRHRQHLRLREDIVQDRIRHDQRHEETGARKLEHKMDKTDEILGWTVWGYKSGFSKSVVRRNSWPDAWSGASTTAYTKAHFLSIDHRSVRFWHHCCWQDKQLSGTIPRRRCCHELWRPRLRSKNKEAVIS